MTPAERRAIVALAKELEDYERSRNAFAPPPDCWRVLDAARTVVQLVIP